MIALIQRVKKGSVTVSGRLVSEIDTGLVILLGIFQDDEKEDVEKLTKKIVNLRIMSDLEGKMNRSIIDTEGDILIISQFTLCADLKYGRRPSFIKAKDPGEAEKLYRLFVKELQKKQIKVKTGEFGTYMQVFLINDGPVTIIVDSRKL